MSSKDTALPFLPATVPGHIHLDLLEAGVIGDPFERMQERGARWVDETDWVYATTFHLSRRPADNTLLVFDGLDTVAEINLNGSELGRTDNMFIPHEFPVGDRLRWGNGDAGANTLQVTFRSALRIGRERTQGGEYYKPRSFVRKAQYMYGWDWGPELVSSGIWRPVRLVEAPVARLLDFQYDVVFTDCHTAIVTFEVFVERASMCLDTCLNLTIAFTRAGNEVEALDVPLPAPVTVDVPAGAGRIAASATVTVEYCERWWPNRHNPAGVGVHPVLYSVDFTLADNTGARVDGRSVRIGLRHIELIQAPDADGKASFKFRINGHDIFVRGANWIPADSFPSRLENEGGRLDGAELADDRVHNLIWMACDAGFNMLRVWGGGLYESEHFYELCDEHGILVWQDFPYACAYYPDTGAYAEAARVEAVAAVRRLRSHPCLALWCGNNENDWMYHARWGGVAPERHFGEKLYHEVLPAALAEEDARTPYWPSSPFGGDDPNSPDVGDRHNWDVWHGVGDWKQYTEDVSRFVSEFGFASSCSLAAWDTCLSDDDRTAHSPAVRWHDKTRKGYETYLSLVALHYPEPLTLEDLVYYTQLNQADALQFGVEHYRRHKGSCWGTIFWQFNDCWPVQSWSIVDSELQPKAAFYAARRFYAPVLLSFALAGDSVEIHVTNDALGPVAGTVKAALKTFTGETFTETSIGILLEPNSTKKVGVLNVAAYKGIETATYVTGVLTAPGGPAIALNHLLLAEPKDLALPEPNLVVTVGELDADTLSVTVQTDVFAASVWLFVDPAGPGAVPEFSDNFFHLDPGETRTVTVEKTSEFDSIDALRSALRVRTLYGESL